MRIAFAGTPLFAQIQLRALLASGHDVVVVYTQPDKPAGRGRHLTRSPVKQLALEHRIPVEQPTSLKNTLAENTFAAYQVDVMIVAAYGLILPAFFLTCPRYGCINVHASLLPRWRGASPIQQAILAGDPETGITFMKMDQGLDTGNIIEQIACPIVPTDTASDLHDKLALLGANALAQRLDRLVSHPSIAQRAEDVTYAPKIQKEEAQCQWHLPAIDIERRIRAFQPWPILHSMIAHQVLRLWQARVVASSVSATPGTIVAHTEEGIVIATTQEALLLTRAQLPGKKNLPMPELLHGHPTWFAVEQSFQ